jgi:hypothetical protein
MRITPHYFARRLGSASVVGLTALCLAFVLAGPVRSAQAALQLSVGNPGLQHFDTDGGVDLDFGLTDQSGAPVGNLKQDDVKVFEDGTPAKILNFRGLGQGRPVDIVFVIDITESMQPYIDAVKENVIAFAQDLAANHRDYRLGLVTFEDYVVSSFPDCGCPYRDKMTSDVHEFINWIGTLRAGGGGDIPEDQLDALAYASNFPFRPAAQGILILITDAQNHHAGDGSAYTQHDAAYWAHHKAGTQVTDLTADKVAEMLKRQGLTLYAVVPPPFIAPDYASLVQATHGRSYNIVTEESRFPELVRQIGHTIATEYSLTYETPRPIEDGTERRVELQVNYGGQSAVAQTTYRVRGIGGARINVPEPGATGAQAARGQELFFAWWNGIIPLIAVLGLLALSRARFVQVDELKAALAAAERGPTGAVGAQFSRAQAPARPAPAPARAVAAGPAPGPRVARLIAINPSEPVASEYNVAKPEVTLGRGEENDLVIPHPSVSRSHALLRRRGQSYEISDLGSTNGTFVNNQRVNGSMALGDGAEVRLGEVAFILHC